MTATAPLSPAIVERLSDIRIDRTAVSVTIDGTELNAETLRDLRQLLSGHLYSSWHIRRESTDDDSDPHRDPAFEKVLSAHTPHETTIALVTVVDDHDPDGSIVVLDGVRVRLPEHTKIEHTRIGDTGIGDTRIDGRAVTIPSTRPALSPGFWLADSSVGRLLRAGSIRRFYLAIDSRDDAPLVWRHTLDALESAGIRYRAKVGSTHRTYPRSDSMVIYVDDNPDLRQRVAGILGELVAGGMPVGSSSSLFTESVAHGIGTAEEPRDARPGMSRMSFGEHRCFALATGILESGHDGDEVSDVLVRVHRAFLDANIQPDNPALNNDTPRGNHTP
ncbi:T3SS effector HopA1 family protein [Rhodococcus sp. G-MC3]|uniref:T3SS effector HopA1 family protein n=1 Tax=Rhodococcus sp. G-MC3 TaxID=3046209 RepID=UPI0024B8ACE9|nr:T3SS effector HopA1 family protein [Rhodococcus sp. G-MC3]MDJ0393818.1 T3SS effector HopA1 family protein [Rhodococcus sp. G-MC3]